MQTTAIDDNMLNEEMPEHEIKRHVETLHDAEKIKGNSKLMSKLAPHIAAHKKAAGKIGSLDELKAVAKKKTSQPDSDGDYD